MAGNVFCTFDFALKLWEKSSSGRRDAGYQYTPGLFGHTQPGRESLSDYNFPRKGILSSCLASDHDGMVIFWLIFFYYHKCSGLKEHKFVFSQSWGATWVSLDWAKVQKLAKLYSFLEAPGENLFPYSFQLLEAAHILGLWLLPHLQSQQGHTSWCLSSIVVSSSHRLGSPASIIHVEGSDYIESNCILRTIRSTSSQL